MIVSEARTNANRRNARLSTGPKTLEGKARSRANALKHGLCASVVVAEDSELIESRARDLYNALKPQNAYHLWVVDIAAVASVRIDRCIRQERRCRDKRSLRAELFWDDDRQLEAARLGSLLQGNPDEVVKALKRTPQGCEWLMTRWAMLAHAADISQGKGWTTAQKRLAFDLLATPEEFRNGYEPGAELDFEGRVIADSTDPAAVACREIAALKERRETVDLFDEALQSLTVDDLGNDEDDPELKKLRRYEASLHNKFRWCVNQIGTKCAYHYPGVGFVSYIPSPVAETLPPIAPDPDPLKKPEEPPPPLTKFDHPPFDLEPDEYPAKDEVADIPAILAKRAEKKLQKVVETRNQRRRKLEKLREAG